MKVSGILVTILLVVIIVSLLQSEPGFNGTTQVVVDQDVILYNQEMLQLQS